jgi:hypothetical protein
MRRAERTNHFLVFACKGICAVSGLLEHLLLLLIWVFLVCGGSYLSPMTLVKKGPIAIECFELHLGLWLETAVVDQISAGLDDSFALAVDKDSLNREEGIILLAWVELPRVIVQVLD